MYSSLAVTAFFGAQFLATIVPATCTSSSPTKAKRVNSVQGYYCGEDDQCFSNLGLPCYDLYDRAHQVPSAEEGKCVQAYVSDHHVFVCELPCDSESD